MFPVDQSRMVIIGTLIETMSGLPFVWNYQNLKEPEVPFLSGRLVSTSEDLMNDKTYSKQVVDEVVVSVAETIRSIQEYMLYLRGKGSGANRALKDVSAKLRLTVYRDTLLTSGFCFINPTPVIDLTGIVGTTYIEEASVDLLLRTSVDVSGASELMQTITVTNGGDV
jgi:hypothetical protein